MGELLLDLWEREEESAEGNLQLHMHAVLHFMKLRRQ